MREKWNIESARILWEQNGLSLLETNYVNSRTPMKGICHRNHNPWYAPLNRIQQGHGCPECANSTLRIEQVRQIVESAGFVLLDDSYTNSRTPVKISGRCGHEPWEAIVGNIKRGVGGCAACCKNKKLDIEEIKSRGKSLGLTLVSKEYFGVSFKLSFECDSCKNVRNIIPSSLSQLRHGCHCKGRNSLQEQIVFDFIKNIYPDAVKKKNNIFKNKRSELDIYIPSSRKGVEYDGFYWHKSKRAITQGMVQKDKQKDLECMSLGIEIFRIDDRDFDTKYKSANPDLVLDKLILFLQSPNLLMGI